MNSERKRGCEFDYWAIFPYFCSKNGLEIVLFHIDNRWQPFKTESDLSFDEIYVLVNHELGVYETDCFPDRFIPGANDSDFPTEHDVIIWTSLLRLKSKSRFSPTGKKCKKFAWYSKKEVKEKLTDKYDLLAFRTEFKEDTFWECLDTRKFGSTYKVRG